MRTKRKRNLLRSAEVPLWVIQASLDSRPAASTCRSKILLSLDWTSLSFWGTEYLWPTKKNSETSTITSSGAGRLQRTCLSMKAEVEVCVNSICLWSQSRTPRPQLLQRDLRAPKVQQSSHEWGSYLYKSQTSGKRVAVENFAWVCRGDWWPGNRMGSLISAAVSCLLWSVEEAPGPSTGDLPSHGRVSWFYLKEKTGSRSHQKIKTKQVCLLLFWGVCVCVCVRGPGDCHLISAYSLRRPNHNTRKWKTNLQLQRFPMLLK